MTKPKHTPDCRWSNRIDCVCKPTSASPLPITLDGVKYCPLCGAYSSEFYEGPDDQQKSIETSVNLFPRLVDALEEVVNDIPRINKKEFYRELLKEARGVGK